MSAPAEVIALVERFEAHRESYASGAYNETQLRREFIDPFFEALGWDVQNKQGFAEAYKDVVHEDTIKIGVLTKAPDYCFRIGGARKFFVETKKPSVNIKGDPGPAFQLRRYAWSAKLPLSILTDFDEFAVYDCRVKPVPADKASAARILYLTHTDYPQQWDEIAAVFRRESVLKGSFDKYAEGRRGKRGTAEVDTAFLSEIESWRDLLARNLALRNPDLTTRELNFAVQRIIDRIIFLRICEDRGVEEYGRLHSLLNGERVYSRLSELFQRADDRYNSGLFHFREERGRAEPPDHLTLDLKIDDKALKDIVRDLYYPDSPYEFSVLPADILGQVYEQFLGKVIRLTSAHRAVIEHKPEVKKAGGVYYTPTYIVDYIVEQTVAKLLEGKTPNQVAKLRIIDPACGSGSFLIAAYQRLLDWHRDRYVSDGPERHRKLLYQGPGGAWRLTTTERKRILLNSIYGVDIDPQAVEVTKLSLLLKVLEGESAERLERQCRLLHERALPDLGNNIKCGNSIVSTDFWASEQLELVENGERARVNAFDWTTEFRCVLRTPGRGFDVVIGNPPYVLTQSLGTPTVQTYLSSKYPTARYKVDTYQVFMEKAWQLTAEQGFVGFITPNTFLRNKFALALRRLLVDRTEILKLHLLDYPVFARASVDTAVTVFRCSRTPREDHTVEVSRASSPQRTVHVGSVCQKDWASREDLNFDLPVPEEAAAIVEKMQRRGVALGTFATAYFGIQTHDRKQYVAPDPGSKQWKPALDGSNIGRYALTPPSEYVCLGSAAVKSGGDLEVYEKPRIGVRQIGRRPVATILPGGAYSLNTIYNIFFTREVRYSLEYVLAVLNSKALGWYWERKYFDQKRTFPKVKKAPLLALPIPRIDFTKGPEIALHSRLVRLVESVLRLQIRAPTVRTDSERAVIARQIDATDQEIDDLVYDLYGLTDEQVRLIEGWAD